MGTMGGVGNDHGEDISDLLLLSHTDLTMLFSMLRKIDNMKDSFTAFTGCY